MQVEWNETGSAVTFIREEGDPKFYGIREAKGEHALLHYLKKHFNAEGNDFIKKRVEKDGHMMGDEYQPYLRTRNAKSKGLNCCIYSGFYALRGANTDWNEGKVTLLCERPYWKQTA